MLVFVILAISGFFIGDRWLGIRPRPVSLVLGTGLALGLFLLGLNGGLKLGLDPTWSVVLGVFFCLTLAGLGRTIDCEPSSWNIKSWEWVLWSLFTLGFWTVTNLQQWLQVDEDFWIHTPLQANFKNGVFPPHNPFFFDIELRGHYGRDLLIGTLARLEDWDVLRAQFHFTSVCQVLMFLTCWLTLRRYHSPFASALGTAFCLFGVNVGYQPGLIRGHHANYGPAYLMFFVGVFLVLEIFHRPRYSTAVLLGLSLASTALIYETVMVGVFLGGALLLLERKQCFKHLMLASLIAFSFALTQGGAFSHLLQGGPEESVGSKRQRQTVRLSIPSENLFRVPMSEPFTSTAARYSPNKPVYDWLNRKFHHFDGFVWLFSLGVLGMHSWSLWLSPLTLYGLKRKPDKTAQLFFQIGLVVFLIPGLVGFGEVFNGEWLRWHVQAGLCFALAFALVLARFFGESRLFLKLLLLIPIWLNLGAGLEYAAAPLRFTIYPPLTILGLDFDTTRYVTYHHRTFKVYSGDAKAFRWLKRNSKPGQTIFVNFNPSTPWGILFESTLAGISELRPVGHAVPREQDYVGQPPQRMLSNYANFLSTPGKPGVEIPKFDWFFLKLRPDEREMLLKYEVGGLRMVYSVGGSDEYQRVIFQKDDLATP